MSELSIQKRRTFDYHRPLLDNAKLQGGLSFCVIHMARLVMRTRLEPASLQLRVFRSSPKILETCDVSVLSHLTPKTDSKYLVNLSRRIVISDSSYVKSYHMDLYLKASNLISNVLNGKKSVETLEMTT